MWIVRGHICAIKYETIHSWILAIKMNLLPKENREEVPIVFECEFDKILE